MNLWPTGDTAPPVGELGSGRFRDPSAVPDVWDGRYGDTMLLVHVKGDWTDLGATRLACETVKPILTAHGVGDQRFAIYLPTGELIATGSRCP